MAKKIKIAELFCGKKESVRRQIGMAVPPMGAKTIFDNLKRFYYSRET